MSGKRNAIIRQYDESNSWTMHFPFEKFITNVRDVYSFEKKRKEKCAKRIAFLQNTRLTCQLNLYIYIYNDIFALLKYDSIYSVLFLISHFSRH